MSVHTFARGDRVQFESIRRGRHLTITGSIAKIRVKHRRKVKSLARQLGATPPPDPVVAEVVPDDSKSVWTVPVTRLTYLGTGNAAEARKVSTEIKTNRKTVRAERVSENTDEIYNRDLQDLKPGDEIEVKFSSGWQTAKFVAFTANRRVKFSRPGRHGSAPPAIVRLPGAAE